MNLTASDYAEMDDSMCQGLVNRTAKVRANNKIVHADYVTKEDGPFYCPDCFSDAIVRKCAEKEDHFAHCANKTKLFGSAESKLHFDCKTEICKILQMRYPDGNWEVERPLPENINKQLARVVPDISGRIDGKPIAIEIQRSLLNIKTIKHRTREYSKRGVAILWIVPLAKKIDDSPFRPRMFEKFLHMFCHGRTYYWTPGSGTTVTPVHYGKAERYIEVSQWYEDGEERSVGGYYKTLKTIKQPICPDKVDLCSFKVELANKYIPDNEEFEVPERLIFKDIIPHWWKNYKPLRDNEEYIRNLAFQRQSLNELEEDE